MQSGEEADRQPRPLHSFWAAVRAATGRHQQRAEELLAEGCRASHPHPAPHSLRFPQYAV